jgi:hypothetical protein
MFVKMEQESQAQFENEMVSLTTMMKAEDKSRTQFHNEAASLRTMMKVDEERVQTLKRVNSIKTLTKAEDESRLEFQKLSALGLTDCFEVEVTLRLTVSKSWCRAPSGARDRIFITV